MDVAINQCFAQLVRSVRDETVPHCMGKNRHVARLYAQLHRFRDIRPLLESPLWKGPIVTTRDEREVPHIRFRQIGQEILELDLERQTAVTDPQLSHRLTTICVQKSLTLRIGRTHQYLRHAQVYVRAHQFKHHRKRHGMIHQVNEDIVVLHNVSQIQPGTRLHIGLLEVFLIHLIDDSCQVLDFL